MKKVSNKERKKERVNEREMDSSIKTVEAIEVLQEISDAVVLLAKQVSSSVVRVGAGRGSGSGVVWSDDGYIVTSNHVVDRSDSVEIGLGDGSTIEAKIVGQDRETDVALLKIEADLKKNGLVPIQRGDSDKLEVGQFVLALANAFGDRPAATSGIITSAHRNLRGGSRWGGRRMWFAPMEEIVVTDARLNPGYSGGPLVDAQGRMIGLSAAYAFSRGLAIPVNVVKDVAEKLAKEGRIRKGYLGVMLNEVELPEESAKQLGQDEGLMVLSVSPDTPAKKAGLAMGDVIVKLAGKKVENLYDLQRLLTDQVIGREITISVLRSEKLQEFKITPSDYVSQ